MHCTDFALIRSNDRQFPFYTPQRNYTASLRNTTKVILVLILYISEHGFTKQVCHVSPICTDLDVLQYLETRGISKVDH
jgi:hypothetical protein